MGFINYPSRKWEKLIHCGSERRRILNDPQWKFDTNTRHVVDFKKPEALAQATLKGSRLVRQAWLSAV